MSALAKRRILAGAVALLLVWPAVHYGMARTWVTDPWELFGFAMYTVPHPRIQVELWATVEGEASQVHPAGTLRKELAAHTRLRTTLGQLVSDEAFTRDLLGRNPSWQAVTLVLHHWRLDPETARWAVEPERIVVERADL